MLCMPQCKNISREHDRLEVIDSHSPSHPTLTSSSLKSKRHSIPERLRALESTGLNAGWVQARALSDKDHILWPEGQLPMPQKTPHYLLSLNLHRCPSSDRLTSSLAMDSLRLLTSAQPYLKPSPQALTSSQYWGRTGTCRCVQTVVAPGQTPGPIVSEHQVGSSAGHSSEPAGEEGGERWWVKGPEAPGLPLLHSGTG